MYTTIQYLNCHCNIGYIQLLITTKTGKNVKIASRTKLQHEHLSVQSNQVAFNNNTVTSSPICKICIKGPEIKSHFVPRVNYM